MNTMDLRKYNYHHVYQGFIMPALKETLKWPSNAEVMAVFCNSTLVWWQLASEEGSIQ